MNVQASEVLSKFLLLHWPDILEVLVSEYYDASLSNQ